MSFVVYGINHQTCPLEIRERLYLDAQKVRRALERGAAAASLEELLVLSTCNRTELYGFAGDEIDWRSNLRSFLSEISGVPADGFEAYTQAFEGKEAVRYIFRVAAGLESLVVGESEILGQMRDAFRTGNEEKTVHSLLYRLMEKALKNGKDVRSATKINEGAVSIPSVAVELAGKIFGRLAGEKVMVIGTGQMSVLTLKCLRSSGAEIRYVVSRDPATGEKTAAEFEAVWVPIDRWESCLSKVDILISSTASPEPIIRRAQIERAMTERRSGPLFMIDIAVPRDIEAGVNGIDDVYLYNIDDLKTVADANLRLRQTEIKRAEELTEEAVLSFAGWLEQLQARPTIQRFEAFLDGILKEELEVMLKDSGLDESRRQAARERIRAKLLHSPIARIKEASRNGGVDRYLEALQSLFNLDKEKREGK